MSITLKERMEERNQKLIDTVIRRIERDCPDAVAMIGICGSFCNGDFHERSDLDLMILIDDEEAWKIAECFVVGEVGFDFYCTTWESLESSVKCETPYMAKLMDTKIVYCKKPEALERYMAMREQAKSILEAPFCKEDLERAEKEYKTAETAFSKLMRCPDTVFDCRCHAVELMYYLENAVCILNKTYFKMGVKRMFEEFAAMQMVPENFESLVRALCAGETPEEIRTAAAALMRETDKCFENAKSTLPAEEKAKTCADNLRGCLEEMISNFRGKVWMAIERGDVHASLSALASLQSFFDDLYAGLDMPRYDALSGFDPKDLKKSAEWYETALKNFAAEYEKAGMPLNAFDTVEDFAEHYLK